MGTINAEIMYLPFFGSINKVFVDTSIFVYLPKKYSRYNITNPEIPLARLCKALKPAGVIEIMV